MQNDEIFIRQCIDRIIESAHMRESTAKGEPNKSEGQAAYWNGVAYGLEQLRRCLDGEVCELIQVAGVRRSTKEQ